MTMDLDSINQPVGQNMKLEQVDNVARALLSLTRHVCVLTDRLAVLETVLSNQGMDMQALIDTYQPDQAFKERVSAQTSSIIADIVSDLHGD